MSFRWCFQCGLDYVETVAACVECGVETVDYPPTPPERVGSAYDDQLAYELHAWPYEARAEVEQLLHRRDVAHGWQGPSLIVLEADEELVDQLLAGVDSGDADEAADLDLAAVDAEPEPVEGPEPYQVVESLFLASDVLGRNPRDGRAYATVLDLAEIVTGMARPFGFDNAVWDAIRASTEELASALAVDGRDDEVAERADALARLLRSYV